MIGNMKFSSWTHKFFFYFILLVLPPLQNKLLLVSVKVLVCADGATSKLATQLGIVSTPPSSQCSRAYVEGGTHKFKADGVVFWNSELLPGKSFIDYYFLIAN